MKAKSLLLLIPCLLLASCGNNTPEQGGNNNPGGNGGNGGNGGETVDPGKPLDGYYKTISENDSGAILLGKVRDLMVTTHTHWASYNDSRGPNVGGYAHKVDYDPADKDNKLIMFYSGVSHSNQWDQAATWNREHVWPKSKANGNFGSNGKSYGGPDMHHLRPEFTHVNGARGNRKFGELNGQGTKVTASGVTAAYYAGDNEDGKWEPQDSKKGDCARIVFYMFTHYNNPSNLDRYDGLDQPCKSVANSQGSTGAMIFTEVVSASSDVEAIKLMMKWHQEDPVDELERNRNDGAFGIQHNRNAFIDHPEFVEKIWGNL